MYTEFPVWLQKNIEIVVHTDQHRYYRSLVKYLKKLYINSYIHILNKIIYFISTNMVSENICLLCKHYWITCMQLNFMYDSIDAGNFVISVFLDFKKAFDTVAHKILLPKLHFYGISGISHEWIKSYLSGRNQITVIDGIASPSYSISHGVPKRVWPRSIIVFNIYKWSAKLVVLIQVYTICRWQCSVDFVCWRKRYGIYINSYSWAQQCQLLANIKSYLTICIQIQNIWSSRTENDYI